MCNVTPFRVANQPLPITPFRVHFWGWLTSMSSSILCEWPPRDKHIQENFANQWYPNKKTKQKKNKNKKKWQNNDYQEIHLFGTSNVVTIEEKKMCVKICILKFLLGLKYNSLVVLNFFGVGSGRRIIFFKNFFFFQIKLKATRNYSLYLPSKSTLPKNLFIQVLNQY